MAAWEHTCNAESGAHRLVNEEQIILPTPCACTDSCRNDCWQTAWVSDPLEDLGLSCNAGFQHAAWP